MSEPPAKELSTHEKNIAEQAHELFEDLDVAELERVLDHVQRRLAVSKAADQTGDRIMYARGRPSGPLGKLDTPLKTWLDEGTAELFRRKAFMRDQESSAALRDCAYAWVHGKTYTVMAAEKALHDADAMDIREQMTGPFAGREFNVADTTR